MLNALYKSTVLSAAALVGIAYIGMAPPAAAAYSCVTYVNASPIAPMGGGSDGSGGNWVVVGGSFSVTTVNQQNQSTPWPNVYSWEEGNDFFGPPEGGCSGWNQPACQIQWQAAQVYATQTVAVKSGCPFVGTTPSSFACPSGCDGGLYGLGGGSGNGYPGGGGAGSPPPGGGGAGSPPPGGGGAGSPPGGR